MLATVKPVELLIALLVPLLGFAAWSWIGAAKERAARRASRALAEALAAQMGLAMREGPEPGATAVHGVYAGRPLEISVGKLNVGVAVGLAPHVLPGGMRVAYSPGPRGGLQHHEDLRTGLVATTGDSVFDAKFQIVSLDGAPATAHAARIGAATRAALVGIASEAHPYRPLSIDQEVLKFTVGQHAGDLESAVTQVIDGVQRGLDLAARLERVLTT